MPKLSDTMIEGTLVSWKKKKGDKVSAGEVIAEIETDKATMEWESPEDGTLTEIYVKEGGEGKCWRQDRVHWRAKAKKRPRKKRNRKGNRKRKRNRRLRLKNPHRRKRREKKPPRLRQRKPL